jgi:hypothetical protein
MFFFVGVFRWKFLPKYKVCCEDRDFKGSDLLEEGISNQDLFRQ